MYNIAQLKRTDIPIESYYTNVSYEQGYFNNKNVNFNFIFQDIKVTAKTIIAPINTYYLKFKVRHNTLYPQDFAIKLTNNDSLNPSSMTIKELSVKIGEEDDYEVFEMIFTPNESYNNIIFELSRISNDFLISNSDGTNGRKMDIEVLDLYILNNIIDNYLVSRFNLKKIKQIGIQGPPGLLFTIDGEEIRIGRSGIYELHDNIISITYLGFVLKDSDLMEDGKDFFIMDFAY